MPFSISLIEHFLLCSQLIYVNRFSLRLIIVPLKLFYYENKFGVDDEGTTFSAFKVFFILSHIFLNSLWFYSNSSSPTVQLDDKSNLIHSPLLMPSCSWQVIGSREMLKAIRKMKRVHEMRWGKLFTEYVL